MSDGGGGGRNLSEGTTPLLSCCTCSNIFSSELKEEGERVKKEEQDYVTTTYSWRRGGMTAGCDRPAGNKDMWWRVTASSAFSSFICIIVIKLGIKNEYVTGAI